MGTVSHRVKRWTALVVALCLGLAPLAARAAGGELKPGFYNNTDSGGRVGTTYLDERGRIAGTDRVYGYYVTGDPKTASIHDAGYYFYDPESGCGIFSSTLDPSIGMGTLKWNAEKRLWDWKVGGDSGTLQRFEEAGR